MTTNLYNPAYREINNAGHAVVGNPAHTIVNNTAPMDTFIQPKITGYRQLSTAEAELMNQAKELGSKFEILVAQLNSYYRSQRDAAGAEETFRITNAEPARWLAMGRTDIQNGVMKIVRSIAQPAS